MSGENLARGFQLKISDMATVPAFTVIKNLFSPSGPNRSRETIAFDHHGLTAEGYLLGKIQNGTFSFSIYYDSTDTQHQALRDGVDDGTDYDWKAIFTDAGAEVADFTGYVNSFNMQSEVDGLVIADVEITLTSSPTYT